MRNKFEEDTYRQLVRLYDEESVDYEPDHFSYVVSGSYTPDFRIQLPDGTYFYIETKGYFRQKDMRIIRAVKDCNPGLDLRMLFYRNDKYSKKMRYADWAEKNELEYAIGTVPEDWR